MEQANPPSPNPNPKQIDLERRLAKLEEWAEKWTENNLHNLDTVRTAFRHSDAHLFVLRRALQEIITRDFVRLYEDYTKLEGNIEALNLWSRGLVSVDEALRMALEPADTALVVPDITEGEVRIFGGSTNG